MNTINRPLLLSIALAIAAFAGGCARTPSSDTQTAPSDGESAAGEPQQVAPPTAPLIACAMVTAAEMSEILGAAVAVQANDRSNGKTECIYSPVEGFSPYVELAVEWGSGEAAMQGMGMAGSLEPGLANPYEGIGDQAIAVGPMLAIRTGDDLVTIVLSGVDDAPATARRIFEATKAEM
jgi:hypothetical protein